MDPTWLRIDLNNVENIENGTQNMKIEDLFFNDFLAHGKNAKIRGKNAERRNG